MNTKRVTRLSAIGVGLFLALVGFGEASAQITNSGCHVGNSVYASSFSQNTNNQNCNNEADADGEIDQEGNSSSGDGVAGQVGGVVSAGDASVDATNRSDDVSVSTGDATGANTAALNVASGIAAVQGPGAINSSGCHVGGFVFASANSQNTNTQSCVNSGDADGEIGQSADAASGDGVGGQVIGVVTAAGGSARLVLDNESTDSEIDSGNANFANNGNADVRSISFFVGP